MHPISDKELDKLFLQRLEYMEFQPSGDIWGKITSTMDHNGKAKKAFPIFWTAAASVLVVLGACLWLYRPVEMIRLQGPAQNTVQDIPQSPLSDLGTGAPGLDPHQPEMKGFDFAKYAASEKKFTHTLEEPTSPEEAEDETPSLDVTVSNTPAKRIIAELTLPGKEVKVPRYTGDQSQLDVTQPDLIASAGVEHNDLVPQQDPARPKRIRSVGSLVNFVISKVDRREDKIIEFKDGEEGSVVSGINLGLIKLKSRDK